MAAPRPPSDDAMSAVDSRKIRSRIASEHSATGNLTSQAVSLALALKHNEDVRNKLERWTDELAAINELLLGIVASPSLSNSLECAIDRCDALESTIQESADSLATVNVGLTEGITEGKKLALKLQRSHTQGKKVRQEALLDPLTSLPNRQVFDDRLKLALAQAARHGRRFAVMFIDLDGFKRINDTYGHEAGDDVLRQVAQRLQASVRAEDTVSRRSGDEFLCLIVEPGSQRALAAFVARIFARVCEAMEVDSLRLTIEPSIGVAVYPDNGRSAEALLLHADTAMYSAKRRISTAAPATHPAA